MVSGVRSATALLATQAVLLGVFPIAVQAATFRLEEATVVPQQSVE